MTRTPLPAAPPGLTAGTTAGEFLLGSEPAAALRERLADAGVLDEAPRVLARAPKAARGVLEHELASVAGGFLDVDLGGTLVKGWRLHSQLQAAGDETLAAPGLTSVVEVATHTVKARWKPRIDVTLGATSVAHLSFELAVSFRVVGLLASVTGGRLTSLAGGRGEVSVTFSVAGTELAARKAPFDPHVAVPLGDGIPLATARIPQQPAVDVVVLPDDEPPARGGDGVTREPAEPGPVLGRLE